MTTSTHLSPERRFWLTHLVIPTILFVVLIALCELTPIDIAIADLSFDFATGRWPARDAWWAEWLLHKRGRDLVAIIGVAALVGWVVSFRAASLRPVRTHLLYLVLSIALGTGIVTLGKKLTGRHCPWDMDRYGGTIPYTRLFEGAPPGCPDGNCFPAGHASGGYALMSLYFLFRDRNRRHARLGLMTGFVLGGLFGASQMMRGAHFLSHTVWTAWICWIVALALYAGFRRALSRH